MRYGFFDDQQNEYVITRPDTPLPWINYLGTEAYFGIISNTAGGYSFYKDARLRRITRYRYNNAPLDSGGRYVYLRDNESTSQDYWSPTWQPTRKLLDFYECRHGLGYTVIKSSRRGIKTEARYFVPLGEDLEVWDVIITNDRPESANLSLFSVLEFCLWDAVDDSNNFQRNYSIGEVEVEKNVIYHKSEYRERRNHFAFFACSTDIKGFETQRENFLGPYRGWNEPLAVENGKLASTIAQGWQPIGCHQIDLFLKRGESIRIIFLLGYQENPVPEKFDPKGSQIINKRRAKQVIEKYTKIEMVDEAYIDLKDHWKQLLSKLVIDTPNIHANRMVNTWNAYQLVITHNLSRQHPILNPE